MDQFSKKSQTVGGFEGIAVFNMSSCDVFKKATSQKEAFLVIKVTNTTSQSIILPSYITQSNLSPLIRWFCDG